MIRKENLQEVIEKLNFKPIAEKRFEKAYSVFSCSIIVDFEAEKIFYPEDKGLKVNNHTTCNFSAPENFVVLVCIDRLLTKGYRPEHIELERNWYSKSGRADICVSDLNGKTLFILECKTAGREYARAKNKMLSEGGQLFAYWQQDKSSKWLVLFTVDFENDEFTFEAESVSCTDDENLVTAAKKNPNILLYAKAETKEALHTVWKESYDRQFCGDVIFREDSVAYEPERKPLRKGGLNDFGANDKIVNKFEEILRHNNVSDKENAFNKLISLFICKVVDEMQKGDDDILDFQYRVGTDTYKTLQDRLQRLYQEGMKNFMREDISYVSDDDLEHIVQQFCGERRTNLLKHLKEKIHVLKFYTNNEFSFKDVHNEELFFQNGKILKEVVQLFQGYRIIGSKDLQVLGDLFEQLLNKGFKQNEGQFFTPIPITRFIWDSLPVERIVHKDGNIHFPMVIDYACGAGHFLTQGYKANKEALLKIVPDLQNIDALIEQNLYGIEKDYRLARVSQISLFMHGAGGGNIIFGDGLDNHPEKGIKQGVFDILVANPPYSVKAFKPHMELKNNKLNISDVVSNDGSEIETLFVERIAQLLKPGGVAAVLLPSSVLNKENESFIKARESLLKNFYIRALVNLEGKTFSATGTNTTVVFLQKCEDADLRADLVKDSVESIFSHVEMDECEDTHIFQGYLQKIGVSKDRFRAFAERKADFTAWEQDDYYKQYVVAFKQSTEYNNKLKQKLFRRLETSEQLKWFNQHFYDYAVSVEKEKMAYFALVYKQNTLIVTAPAENTAQEKFLGYKWSNRKGQEGIQIIKPGGMLYNEEDRYDDNCLAGVIRSTFTEKMCQIPELKEYYYFLRLQDMLDFSGVAFSKAIKTVRIRTPRNDAGLKAYPLNDADIFEIKIGDRVLSTDITEDGQIPVYSANVFEEFGRINKQNIEDFSVPSILWGIDGDWMVNVLPKDYPFYPTDHCGVLRIYSDEILPEYAAIALKKEGEHEKFSRNNRASTQRVSNLVLYIPQKEEQKRIIDEIGRIDSEINAEAENIKNLSEIIKDKFLEMFAKVSNMKPLGEYCDIIKGSTITRDQVTEGEVPVVAGGIAPSCYHNTANREANMITVSASGANAGYVNYWNTPIFASDCNTISPKQGNNINHLYVYYYLLSIQDEIYELQRGAGQPHVYGKDLAKLNIKIPSKEAQEEFVKFVEQADKSKTASQDKIELLKEQRNIIMDKHFIS